MRYKDHLGNEYKTIQEMCKHYNISRQLFYYRLSHGYSLQDTLTAAKTSRQKVYDHTGKLFNTISQMCEYWEISECTYRKWINAGYSKCSVLTKAYKQEKYIGKFCKDHLGNEYKTIKSMCTYYGITPVLYKQRLSAGWSLKAALTTPSRGHKYINRVNNLSYGIFDHLGNEYPSEHAMCKAYGITQTNYKKRIKAGYSVKDALTRPKNLHDNPQKDHLGNNYKSITSMCNYYGITIGTYLKRIKRGYTKEEALLGKVKKFN